MLKAGYITAETTLFVCQNTTEWWQEVGQTSSPAPLEIASEAEKTADGEEQALQQNNHTPGSTHNYRNTFPVPDSRGVSKVLAYVLHV